MLSEFKNKIYAYQVHISNYFVKMDYFKISDLENVADCVHETSQSILLNVFKLSISTVITFHI